VINNPHPPRKQTPPNVKRRDFFPPNSFILVHAKKTEIIYSLPPKKLHKFGKITFFKIKKFISIQSACKIYIFRKRKFLKNCWAQNIFFYHTIILTLLYILFFFVNFTFRVGKISFSCYFLFALHFDEFLFLNWWILRSFRFDCFFLFFFGFLKYLGEY